MNTKPWGSHTLRGCVDWNWLIHTTQRTYQVTPFVGVWIETRYASSQDLPLGVTPFVGVWIETCPSRYTQTASESHTLRGCVDWNKCRPSLLYPIFGHTLRGCVDWNRLIHSAERPYQMSHPSWVCGLKLLRLQNISCRLLVTPFVGVWIETYRQKNMWKTDTSHPSWVCGLKQCCRPWAKMVTTVTPFVGVWIETMNIRTVISILCRHTLRGCVDWNILRNVTLFLLESHTLRGCVDWNKGEHVTD